MGKTSGDAVSMEEGCRVLILAKDGEKEIIAPPDVQYTVRITGTGQGQMSIIQKNIDPVSDEVLNEKAFPDVQVKKDQVFELTMDQGKAETAKLTEIHETGVGTDTITSSAAEKPEKESKETQGESIEKSTNLAGKYLLYGCIGGFLLAALVITVILMLTKNKRQRR